MLRSAYMLVGYYLTLAGFGLAGLVLSCACLPLGLLPATARTDRFFQRVIHRHFAIFAWWIDAARLVRVRLPPTVPPVRQGPGLVLVANHPSLIDITLVLARVPEARCIFKPAIRRNPVLGAAARRAGYLANDGGPDLVRQAAELVAGGEHLVVFPEGTRTPIGAGAGAFRPGFVLIARRAGAALQLLRITSQQPLMTREIPWWRPPHPESAVEVRLGPRLFLAPEADTAAAAAEIEGWYRATPEAAACHVWSPAFRLADAAAA
jgi:1-acyl-sn-glycerol-3-phosphate acyltransferase